MIDAGAYESVFILGDGDAPRTSVIACVDNLRKARRFDRAERDLFCFDDLARDPLARRPNHSASTACAVGVYSDILVHVRSPFGG